MGTPSRATTAASNEQRDGGANPAAYAPGKTTCVDHRRGGPPLVGVGDGNGIR